jgi:3-methyladenine DNA glycosylase/8-oxoguanine DNA glycosylase
VRGKFEPQSVLRLSTRRLRGAGLSAAKAKYLLDLARRVNRGDIDLDGIHELDDEQVIASLTQVHGVGRWTAEMFLIFSLGRPDVLPIDDFGLRSGIQLCDGLPTLPTRAAVRQRGDCWKPYRSVATWYLWQWLRLLRQEPPLK